MILTDYHTCFQLEVNGELYLRVDQHIWFYVDGGSYFQITSESLMDELNNKLKQAFSDRTEERMNKIPEECPPSKSYLEWIEDGGSCSPVTKYRVTFDDKKSNLTNHDIIDTESVSGNYQSDNVRVDSGSGISIRTDDQTSCTETGKGDCPCTGNCLPV